MTVQYRNPKGVRQRRFDREDDPFVELKLYVPRKMYNAIKEIAEDLKLPVSRLGCIAMMNELGREDRFTMDFEIGIKPKNIEDLALALYDYLKKIPSGAGLDTLILCHLDMDLTPGQVVHAHRYLVENKLVELYYPNKAKFTYAEDYRYTRAIGDRPVKTDAPRTVFKKLEGQEVHKKQLDPKRLPTTSVNEKGPIYAAIQQQKIKPRK